MSKWYENCFAYKKECTVWEVTECTALTEMLCKTKGKCKFYKSKEQYWKDRQIYNYINKAGKNDK